MIICPSCTTPETEDHQFCQKCLTNLYHEGEPIEKHRRPMSAWERMKLGFYRSEKRWVENIKSRQFTRDRDGRRIVVSDAGHIPDPPREIWAKPKVRGT